MRYEKDLTRHTELERREFRIAALRERRAGNFLVAGCLQSAGDGLYPVKDLTWFQRLLKWFQGD